MTEFEQSNPKKAAKADKQGNQGYLQIDLPAKLL